MRLNCIEFIARIYLELGAWVPDGSSSRRVAEFGRRHLMLYSELCSQKPELYKLYPKHHLFAHCMELTGANPSNPKLLWNYSDEDEIGKAVLVAGNNHCNQRYLPVCLTARYRRGVKRPHVGDRDGVEG